MLRTDGQTHTRTHAHTHARTDNVKTVYPTTNKVCGRYNKKKNSLLVWETDRKKSVSQDHSPSLSKAIVILNIDFPSYPHPLDRFLQGFRFFSNLVGRRSKKRWVIFWKYQTNHSWHLGSVLYLHTDTNPCMHIWTLTADDTVKPFLSGHWKKKTNYRLMQVKSIAECSKGSILQYFWPSLSYHMLLRSLFFVFFEWLLKKCFIVLTTSMYFLLCGVHRLAVSWIFLLKWDFFTTKKHGSTGPTALGSDGPYFEIMGQWPGPTINLKACSYNYITWGIASCNCTRAISDKCWS